MVVEGGGWILLVIFLAILEACVVRWAGLGTLWEGIVKALDMVALGEKHR